MMENIKSLRKTFLWAGVCILIGEFLTGAILILTQSFDATIGKIMATFALCAVVLFVGVNNFTRMEKGERIVQGFALTSLIANIIWLILAILMIWEVMAVYTYSSFTLEMTVMAKIMCVAVNVATTCFLISNVWAIEETVKPVRPLKITALVCELYCGIYGIIVIFGSTSVMDSRWYALAGLAGFAFIVMALAAVIVSRSGRKKSEKIVSMSESLEKDGDMQAKIQEMVEKEVQARMKSEANKPPILSQDGGEDNQNQMNDQSQTETGEPKIIPIRQSLAGAEELQAGSAPQVEPTPQAEPAPEVNLTSETKPTVETGPAPQPSTASQPGTAVQPGTPSQPQVTGGGTPGSTPSINKF